MGWREDRDRVFDEHEEEQERAEAVGRAFSRIGQALLTETDDDKG